jgi:hypothetical protein
MHFRPSGGLDFGLTSIDKKNTGRITSLCKSIEDRYYLRRLLNSAKEADKKGEGNGQKARRKRTKTQNDQKPRQSLVKLINTLGERSGSQSYSCSIAWMNSTLSSVPITCRHLRKSGRRQRLTQYPERFNTRFNYNRYKGYTDHFT